MSHLKNHLWYADFSKEFSIYGQPIYVTPWDVTKVFTFIKSKPALTTCDLKTLSHRLAILLCLTTDQRGHTIKCLDFDYIKISSDKIVLFVRQNLKTTGPGHHLSPMELKKFKDSGLCVVADLKQYFKMTEPCRHTGTNQLLMTLVQP